MKNNSCKFQENRTIILVLNARARYLAFVRFTRADEFWRFETFIWSGNMTQNWPTVKISSMSDHSKYLLQASQNVYSNRGTGTPPSQGIY